MATGSTVLLLMYFIAPVWLLAGCADWLCHRATHIESATGAKESLIHLLMFSGVGVPMLAVLFLQVNALTVVMIAAFLLHEATAWGVSYAVIAREVTPIEQRVHSFLEMIPLMAMVSVISISLPATYVVTLLAVILLFEFLPYAEEFVRGWRRDPGDRNGGAEIRQKKTQTDPRREV